MRRRRWTRTIAQHVHLVLHVRRGARARARPHAPRAHDRRPRSTTSCARCGAASARRRRRRSRRRVAYTWPTPRPPCCGRRGRRLRARLLRALRGGERAARLPGAARARRLPRATGASGRGLDGRPSALRVRRRTCSSPAPPSSARRCTRPALRGRPPDARWHEHRDAAGCARALAAQEAGRPRASPGAGARANIGEMLLKADPRVEVVAFEDAGQTPTPAQLAFRNSWLGAAR
jgi:hypothetical protein